MNIRRLFARFLCRILAPELDELITAAVNVKVNKQIVTRIVADRFKHEWAEDLSRTVKDFQEQCEVTDTRRHGAER